MKILFRHDNPNFKNRIDYVLRFLEQHPLIKGRFTFVDSKSTDFDKKLYYGIEKGDAFFIPSQKVVFSGVLPIQERLLMNRYNYGEMQLYAIEQKKYAPQAFIKQRHFQFDLIETIFFHISRMEEYYCDSRDLDQYERMDAEKQILVRYKLQEQPVVDQLVWAFAQAMGLNLKPQATILKMTHDIDAIRKNNSFFGQMRTFAAALLKMRDIQRAKRVLEDKSQNPYDTFDWLLLENQNIEKEIYFLVGGTSKYDTPYDLKDPLSQKIIQLAKDRGYRIGIHPSYDTWKDKALMLSEKQKLEQEVDSTIKISRQHYLRFSFKDTSDILDALDIEKDASLGYGDRIGFRSGTGFPYHLYNFKEELPYLFLEEPLVFMESALLDLSGFDANKFEQIWSDFISSNKFNTMITFNFHNSRFYDSALSGIDLKRLYLNLTKG